MKKIFLIAMCTLLLVGCGCSKGAQSSHEEVTKSLCDALKKGDIDAYLKLMPEEIVKDQEITDEDREEFKEGAKENKTCKVETEGEVTSEELKELEEYYNKRYNSKRKFKECKKVLFITDEDKDDGYSCKLENNKWYIFG